MSTQHKGVEAEEEEGDRGPAGTDPTEGHDANAASLVAPLNLPLPIDADNQEAGEGEGASSDEDFEGGSEAEQDDSEGELENLLQEALASWHQEAAQPPSQPEPAHEAGRGAEEASDQELGAAGERMQEERP